MNALADRYSQAEFDRLRLTEEDGFTLCSHCDDMVHVSEIRAETECCNSCHICKACEARRAAEDAEASA